MLIMVGIIFHEVEKLQGYWSEIYSFFFLLNTGKIFSVVISLLCMTE